MEETTASAFRDMQEVAFASKVGLATEVTVNRFQAMLEKFEIPVGLGAKLFGLREFDLLGMFFFH